MKRLLWIFVVVGMPLLIVAWLGLRWYLHSDDVRMQAQDRFAELYGGKVGLDGLSPGVRTTAVDGLELFERDAEDANDAHAWLVAKTVTINVPWWRLTSGAMPSTVAIREASVTLRFDRDG